jgi:hypothetical protein
MIPLSFFAEKPTKSKHLHHLRRGSSLIRAHQIADFIDAKVNPKSDFEDDVCIFIKPSYLRKGETYELPGRKRYVDLVDAYQLFGWFLENPEINVIVVSKANLQDCLDIGLKNKIYPIPQQHCNFENILRPKREILTVGHIGNPDPYLFSNLELLTKSFKVYGLEYKDYYLYMDRNDVVNFYKGIDIQIVWRPDASAYKLKNPMRIINAGSFGIPTVAYPEKAFKEIEGYFIPARTLDEMVEKVVQLKENEDMYFEYTQKVLDLSKNYHISEISKLYLDLLS